MKRGRMAAYEQRERQEQRDRDATRVRGILAYGKWPSGLTLLPYERTLLERNCADLLR